MNKDKQTWHIAFKDKVYGYITLGECFEVHSDEHWRSLVTEHHWDVHERPYKRTIAHHVVSVRAFPVPIQFYKKPCSVGTTIYRDLDLQAACSSGDTEVQEDLGLGGARARFHGSRSSISSSSITLCL